MRSDLLFMNLAMRLALRAKGKTSPNPLVGAVIVKGGKVVGKGFHHRAGLAHAEILALRQAKGKTKGAKLYVTLEPCSHFGRTPPCVDAILNSGIKEVVVGMRDPNPLNNGRSIRILRKNGVKVKVGLLEKELKEINAPFIKYINQGLPYVTIKVGQSIDGKIATFTGQSRWITSEKTRSFTRHLRKFYDAILIGINTVLKDNPALSCKGKAIKKVIVDSALRLPLHSRIFDKTKTEDIIIAATSQASRDKVNRLRRKKVTVLLIDRKNGRVNLRQLMQKLAVLEITNILVEGGGEINASLLKDGLVDKVQFFIAPKIIGGKGAIGSFAGKGVKSVSQAINLHNVKVKNIGQNLWVEGYVYRHH